MTQEQKRIGILHLNDEALTDLYDYVIQFGAVPKVISPMEPVPTDCSLIIVTDCGFIPSPMDAAYINGQQLNIIASSVQHINYLISSFFEDRLEAYLSKRIPMAFFGNSATFAASALSGKLEMVNEFTGRCSIIGTALKGTNMIDVDDGICTSEVTLKAKILSMPLQYEPCMWYTRATRTQYTALTSNQERENAKVHPIGWINMIGKLFLSQTIPWLLKNNVKSLNKIKYGHNSGDAFSNNYIKYLLHNEAKTEGDEFTSIE